MGGLGGRGQLRDEWSLQMRSPDTAVSGVIVTLGSAAMDVTQAINDKNIRTKETWKVYTNNKRNKNQMLVF